MECPTILHHCSKHNTTITTQVGCSELKSSTIHTDGRLVGWLVGWLVGLVVLSAPPQGVSNRLPLARGLIHPQGSIVCVLPT